MESQRRPFFLFLIFPVAILSFFFILLQPISAVGPSFDPTTNFTDFIRTTCNNTRYPDVCFDSLSGYADTVRNDLAQLARLSLSLSLNKTRKLASHFSNLTTTTTTQQPYPPAPAPVPALARDEYLLTTRATDPDSREKAALRDCSTTVRDAVGQMKDSLKQMREATGTAASGNRETFRFMMSNVQTWLSAAFTNEETCTDGFEDLPDSPLKSDACERVHQAEMFTSNALALANLYADSVPAR